MFASASAASADNGRQDVRESFSFYWCADGDASEQIQPPHAVMRQDVVVFYDQFFGLYPKIWQGIHFHGGIPQKTNIQSHIAQLAADLDRMLPSQNWSGLAVIDYESWRPIWEQLDEQYRVASRNYARLLYPGYADQFIEQIAKQQFEDAAREFMLTTINICQALRPNAKWGFYGDPSELDVTDPTRLQWLFDKCDAFFPSIYARHVSVEGQPQHPWEIERWRYGHRVNQLCTTSRNIAGSQREVVAFIWRRYNITTGPYAGLEVLDPDLQIMVRTPGQHGADGVVVWDAIHTFNQALDAHYFGINRLAPEIDCYLRLTDCGDNASGAEQGCPADFNDDGWTNATDLADILTAWGDESTAFDLDGDGVIGAADLSKLLAFWGPCPEE
ncbi:MAG: hypothetical protein VYC34_07745 [Planctomycetota bacterium]|nr:hypothetical protein [Planctomycetota bacterium]